MSRKTWRECTIEALKISSKNSALVHRSALLKEHLNKIVIETKSNGKTPDMTFNRMLQVLRDDGYIRFVTPGVYLWLYKIHNGQLFIQARSSGESLVAAILDELNIIYEEQKTFPDLKYISLLRLDFYIEHNDKKYVIEFDGEQHYRPVDFFGGKDAFELTQLRDAIKNEYCIKNNITMIRISDKKLARQTIINKFL